MKHVVITLLLTLVLAVAALAKVNINTADVEELSTLPGIGPKKAEAIVNDRDTSGTFTSIDDLKRVKGIGDKLLIQLKNKITVTD